MRLTIHLADGTTETYIAPDDTPAVNALEAGYGGQIYTYSHSTEKAGQRTYHYRPAAVVLDIEDLELADD